MSDGSRKVWRVSEIAAVVKDRLEDSFPDVFVRGEVSGLSLPASGHVYFTLKDDKAALRCVLYRHTRRYLRYVPEDGHEILARGKISAYGPRSEYQLVADYFEPVGLGSLYAAFLQLQKELAAKGYFDRERKRPLPFMPRTVGLVTSLAGAALHDVLRIILARRPGQHVVISPALVQGESAPQSIARAIRLLVDHAAPEVIIVARGGGSPEDLWAWNDEIVVEAVAKCPVPVVSGVGHEVDVTLCDWAADVRAATPTHAAETAVPNVRDLQATLRHLQRRAAHHMQSRLAFAQERHTALYRRLIREAVPTAPLIRQLDELRATLFHAMSAATKERHHRVALLTERLRAFSPLVRLSTFERSRSALDRRLAVGFETVVRGAHQHADYLQTKLDALNPLAVLARGYAIVSHQNGAILRRAADAAPAELLDIRLHAGRLSARVEKTENGES